MREPEKETLVGGEPVDFLLRFPRQRFLERGIGDLYSANIGDVLALGQLAVYTQTRQRFVLGILLHDRAGTFLELRRRFRRPPVAQVADLIVLSALIVEPVSHLVADDRANPAIINGIVRFRIEKWRLQNPGREDDLV